MAERHRAFWKWIEALQCGASPRPRVEVWPRGGGKSTTVELACARVATTGTRRYVLYVSATQPQANKHVQSIATMLERLGLPRALNEYGASKGWRHEEIRTASGFSVTAFGLDAGMRGVKLDEIRPDLIVFDDVDDRDDSELTRNKKIGAITSSILPAGSADCAVLVMQNKVYKDSIVSQLCDGRADFLHNREVPTVEPAVRNLVVERVFSDEGASYRIIAGEPTWAGQDIATCEQQINLWGLGAFYREAQHDVEEASGGLWEMARDIEPFRVTNAPELVRVTVAIDPSAGGDGDEAGIVGAGIDARGHGYVIDDSSLRGSSKVWAEAGVAAYHRLTANKLVAEKNQGGDMIAVTIGTVKDAPTVELIHASDGKLTRAKPVQKLYEDGRVHHVGHFRELERELCSWKPTMPSPNRLDALVHCLTDLMLGKTKPTWRML